MKYNHSMPCQCLIPNVVTAAVLSRTNAKKDSLKKGGVPDHASTMKANSEEPILFRGEESQLEDGPTNTHGSHGVLVALNTRRNLNFPGQTYVAIQDNQSTVSISAEDPEYVIVSGHYHTLRRCVLLRSGKPEANSRSLRNQWKAVQRNLSPEIGSKALDQSSSTTDSNLTRSNTRSLIPDITRI